MFIYQEEPNFTVILPGTCQARCAFCAEPEGPAPSSIQKWLTILEQVVKTLPPPFRVISISGGEPTKSKALLPALKIIKASQRFHRVVLTTNGHFKSIMKHRDAITEVVTHLNLSRHATEDKDNMAVFNARTVPSTNEIQQIISAFNGDGVSVNLNCVYSDHKAFGRTLNDEGSQTFLRALADNYLRMARTVGASSVSFRFDHHLFRPDFQSQLERAFDDFKTIKASSCASCKVSLKIIQGIPVNFKQSAYEPTALHPISELYELVFHSNGQLCLDWARRKPISLPLPIYMANPTLAKRVAPKTSSALDDCESPSNEILGLIQLEYNCRVENTVSLWTRQRTDSMDTIRNVDRHLHERAMTLLSILPDEPQISNTSDVVQFQCAYSGVPLCLLLTRDFLEIRVAHTLWSSPHTHELATSFAKRSRGQLHPHKVIGLLQQVAQQRLSTFQQCRFCNSSFAPEHFMEDLNACHGCAQRHCRVIF